MHNGMDEVGEKSADRQLTEKERRLAEHVAQGKSIRHAAEAAGYAPSTAKGKAYKILRSHRVQSFLTDALEQAGITASKIVQPIVDALQATKTVRVKTALGRFEVKTDEPDVALRLEGFDRAERLYGVTLTEHEVPPPPKGNLTVVMVRASDLARAQARQQAVEVNPRPAAPITVEIKKRSEEKR